MSFLLIRDLTRKIFPRKWSQAIRTQYLKCVFYKDVLSAGNYVGEVSSEWRARTDDVIRCPDNEAIPRVTDAGLLRNGWIKMHNGIEVAGLSYYGSGVLNMLIENKGVHEPQEERTFQEILKHIPSGGNMIELGSYWGFYSLWFKTIVPHANCYLIDPDLPRLVSGMCNFAHNGKEGTFDRAYIGAEVKDNPRAPFITVDHFCREKKITRLSILHSDIQGAELDMLAGAEEMLSAQAIDYVFISTHSNPLHYDCIKSLESHKYQILASADLDETYSFDGLIVAKRESLAEPRELTIHKKSK